MSHQDTPAEEHLELDRDLVAAVRDELARLVAVDPFGPLAAQLSDMGSLLGAAVGVGAATPEPAGDVEPQLGPGELTDYLRRSGDDSAIAEDVVYVRGGLSKHTIIVACVLRGQPQEIVLRQVPSGRRESGLADEFDVLRWAWAAGVPVAEPLWLEPAANDLGGPFVVSRRAAGVNLGDVWGPASAPPAAVCDQLAAILGRLHALSPVGLERGPARSMRTTEEIAAAIAEQEERAGAVAEIDPALATLLAWLREHLPSLPAHVAVVHGDVGFHNLLADGDRVTALLDWERCHLGDPAEDLAYVRLSIERFHPWEQFLERYGEAGGHPMRPDAERFYRVWQDVWRHVTCLRLAHDFARSGRFASAVAGHVNGPRFLASATRTAFGGSPC